jgi:hypothetical protein
VWRIVVEVGGNTICRGGPLGAALGRLRKVEGWELMMIEGRGKNAFGETPKAAGGSPAPPRRKRWKNQRKWLVSRLFKGEFCVCGKFILALAVHDGFTKLPWCSSPVSRMLRARFGHGSKR